MNDWLSEKWKSVLSNYNMDIKHSLNLCWELKGLSNCTVCVITLFHSAVKCHYVILASFSLALPRVNIPINTDEVQQSTQQYCSVSQEMLTRFDRWVPLWCLYLSILLISFRITWLTLGHLYESWDDFDGFLPKGRYLRWVSMAGRALLAGYHRFMGYASYMGDTD